MSRHVIVTGTVRSDRMQQWDAIIAKHVAMSRSEPGCSRFELFESQPYFMIYEVWRDGEALAAHRQTPHYANWRATIGAVETEPHAHAEYDGPQVVFTNGCFDLLHAGHVAMLTEARAQGDLLIVGLDTDDSVCRLKGAGRPVRAFADRLAVLAAMRSVDHVVGFDGTSLPRLLETIRPTVLAKGGDYDHANVVGADLVESWGGRVHLTRYTGQSSTQLLKGALCRLIS